MLIAFILGKKSLNISFYFACKLRFSSDQLLHSEIDLAHPLRVKKLTVLNSPLIVVLNNNA